MALQGRRQVGTLAWRREGADSNQISSGNWEGIGRKGTSLASAGPLEGLAGARDVPFLPIP